MTLMRVLLSKYQQDGKTGKLLGLYDFCSAGCRMVEIYTYLTKQFYDRFKINDNDLKKKSYLDHFLR